MHCPAEIHKAFPEIDIVWRGAYVAIKPLYTPFRIHSAFQNMQATIPFTLVHPHSQQECQIWTRLTIEHFFTLKPFILNEPWPTGHDGASGPCSHMASILHDRALVGICRWHGRLLLPTVVSGSIPGPI